MRMKQIDINNTTYKRAGIAEIKITAEGRREGNELVERVPDQSTGWEYCR
jgi:hypothetical protein